MSTDTQEISAPAAPAGEASGKTEKMVFAGDYVADANGRVTFVLSFPLSALEVDERFRPVEGLIGLANQVGLKGYGEGDTPQATLGTERAKITDKATGEKVDNPHAGRPTGTINLVLHTAESLVEARKRGRTATSDATKKALASTSALIKNALQGEGNDIKIQAITEAVSRGEIDTPTALRQIAELMS